ncbi:MULTISPECIES: acyl-CoA dehydrogenase family protein [unclassified Acidovorax]|uniref:acyl-CoA dehydrogenase family protein n=1 Tax=unclassified Acidovorax TaxID=2684926 RepID=UPI000B40023F|nr:MULTISPECIES: acyl-CoA dehydrogenase family protein [unclassified Acidovorax]
MPFDLTDLLHTLRQTAVERDRQGGHATFEKAQIRDAGLLRLAIPQEHGGLEQPWPDIYRLVRQLAAVDSSLAHLLAFHQLQVATVLIYGNAEQQRRWLRRTADEQGWWGNALNPRDTRLLAHGEGPNFLLDGTKGFCSGTRGSSYMTVSARHPGGDQPVLGILATQAPGISVQEDWDPIGQRQTDSGSVRFDQVLLSGVDVMREHHTPPSVFHTLRNCLAQLVLVNLYLGIAQGAQQEARQYAHAEGRPWIVAAVDRATEDPYLLNRMGDMQAQIAAATALAERAAHAAQAAWERGQSLTAAQRGEVALAVAEAKVIAHRAGLFASQELFEVVGSRGTRASLGYDRFWRNVRTHTLHDPLDYKLQTLGRWALNGELPQPANYS